VKACELCVVLHVVAVGEGRAIISVPDVHMLACELCIVLQAVAVGDGRAIYATLKHFIRNVVSSTARSGKHHYTGPGNTSWLSEQDLM